jgi:hypothetical protein
VEKVRVLECMKLVRKKDSAFVRGDFPATLDSMPVMCLEREDPLSLDSKGSLSGAREPYWLRARGVYCYVLWGGGPTVASNAWHPDGPQASHDMVGGPYSLASCSWVISRLLGHIQ